MPVTEPLTLVLVLVCVHLVFAMAFFTLTRHHPSVPGPGWWALASVLGVLAVLLIGLRSRAPDMLSIALGNTVLLASLVLVWFGLRRYLDLQLPLRAAGAALLALFGAHALLYINSDAGAPSMALEVLAIIVLVLCVWRDLRQHRLTRQSREMRAFKRLVATDALLMALLLLPLILWWPASAEVAPYGWLARALLIFYLLNILMGAVLCITLVSYRLQQDSERGRQVLQTREAQSRALIDNLGAAVMVFRPDQTLVSVNNAARSFLGWSEEQVHPVLPESMAQDWRMLREDGQPMRRHEMPFFRVLATAQPVRDVIFGMTAQTQTPLRWALCSAYPETDAMGGLRHVVLTFVDITSLKQAQQQQKSLEGQLAQAQKMEALGTLAGGVAHDFNNILAAILGNAELARQDLPDGAAVHRSLLEISTAARRGRELVRQVLAYSRQQPMAPEPVDLTQVLAETCVLLRAGIAPKIELLQTCGADMAPILADSTQLSQVLLNLGTNACHALQGQAGRIEFRLDQLPPGDGRIPAELAPLCAARGVAAVRLQVQDDGCGMDASTRARIFEPFFTTKQVGSGTGLGLSVVLGIVQAHGGVIEVDSAPGAGTTFTLYFPAMAAPPAPPAPAASLAVQKHDAVEGTMAASAAADFRAAHTVEPTDMADTTSDNPRHILYLDDDDALVFLVRRLLERRGYKVSAFTDQAQAIEAVRRQPDGFDLLLSDYNMPGMSGLDVARAVLAINPALSVALASGYITDELQSSALAAGVREVVFKTDAVEQFCEVVARLARPKPI